MSDNVDKKFQINQTLYTDGGFIFSILVSNDKYF